MNQSDINKVLKDNKIKRPIFKNSLKAFFFGGLVSLFGEIIRLILIKSFNLEVNDANTLMLLIVISLSSIFTAFGIYDKYAQHAGAGSFVPITGFANSLTSACIESKSEGIVEGCLTNMLKLAGAVIATSIICSIVVSSVIYLMRLI